MTTSKRARSARLAGLLVLAFALLALAATAAPARPSIPQFLRAHGTFIAAAPSHASGSTTNGARSPVAGGRVAPAGRGILPVERGRLAPVAATSNGRIYAGLGAALVALAALAIGLIVSERRTRPEAPATAVDVGGGAAPLRPADREAPDEQRKAA